jgi:hypothetical protein
VATEQQGIAVPQLIEGERGQLVVDEVEMPPIHVVDHSIEADERRLHDPSCRDQRLVFLRVRPSGPGDDPVRRSSRNLARRHHPLRDDFAGRLDLRAGESIAIR